PAATTPSPATPARRASRPPFPGRGTGTRSSHPSNRPARGRDCPAPGACPGRIPSPARPVLAVSPGGSAVSEAGRREDGSPGTGLADLADGDDSVTGAD